MGFLLAENPLKIMAGFHGLNHDRVGIDTLICVTHLIAEDPCE
jgi:hypothetical protein